MRTKYLCRLTALLAVGFSLLSSSAKAQPGASGMPDLSDFAGAIAQSAEAPPAKAPDKPGLFKSGLPVPSVKPGETARDLGRQLREGIEKQSGPQPAFAQLEAALPQILSALEGEIEKNGFAKRDMGVAFAVSVLDMYETATKTKVPDAPSKVAIRTLATAIATHWGPKYLALKPEQKEKMYESIIMATILSTLLAQQFEAAGKTDEADTMRQGSAQLFQTLIGVPPAQVKIAEDGTISGLSKE